MSESSAIQNIQTAILTAKNESKKMELANSILEQQNKELKTKEMAESNNKKTEHNFSIKA